MTLNLAIGPCLSSKKERQELARKAGVDKPSELQSGSLPAPGFFLLQKSALMPFLHMLDLVLAAAEANFLAIAKLDVPSRMGPAGSEFIRHIR